MSSFSSFVELILSALRFFSDLFSRKRDEKAELKDKIAKIRKLLNAAIDEGRITDIMSLRKELDELLREYESKAAGKAAVFALLLAIGLLCTGCLSRKPSTPVLVVGERVMTIEPGSVVPPLMPPAKKWYLVDSEAYKTFVGLPSVPED